MFPIPIDTVVEVAFAFIMLIFWVISFVIIYHLTRFGIGVQPKRLAAIFLLGSLGLSGLAMIFFTLTNSGLSAIRIL